MFSMKLEGFLLDDELIAEITEPRHAHGKRRSMKGQKDRVFDFLLVQIAVCCAAALVAFCLKGIGGEVYQRARDKYLATLNDPTSISEVIETVAGLFDLNTPVTPAGGSSQPGESGPQDDTIPAAAPADEESEPAQNESAPSESVSSNGSTSGTESDSSATGEEEGDAGFIIDFNTVGQQLSTHKSNTNTMMMPVSGTITSLYGYRTDPFTGEHTMHGGLDLAAPTGTDIRCALDGTVKTVGNSDSYGQYILVAHGNGLETLYAHCSKILTSRNTAVKRGTIIAKVGSTGRSTGPHCHFEVRTGGARINPQWVLPQVSVT